MEENFKERAKKNETEIFQPLNNLKPFNKQDISHKSGWILTEHVRAAKGHASHHRQLRHKVKTLLDICKKNL